MTQGIGTKWITLEPIRCVGRHLVRRGLRTRSDLQGTEPAVAADMEEQEGPKERVDRELRELLDEVRVALPGVELLFGFLLILPFSERFEILSGAQRGVYLVCLLATVAATALFMAPTAQHRARFREVNKEQLLLRTNRRVIAGLVLVALAIALATALLVWVVVGSLPAAVIGSLVAAWFTAWWFLLPPFWRRDHRARPAQARVTSESRPR